MGEERRDNERREPRPSETMGAGPGGQVNFGDMLRLMDKFHDADQDIRNENKELEERRRSTDAELFTKIEELKEDTRKRDEARREIIEERACEIDSGQDAAIERIVKLETELKAMKSNDEFGDLKFYFRPAWIKAFGLAIAAVIAALIAAFIAMGGKGPPPPLTNPAPPAHEAPEDPGDDAASLEDLVPDLVEVLDD